MTNSSKGMAQSVANLDAMRALAVLLVLLDHILETIAHKYADFSFHPYDWGVGRLGVLLFFVHTSLVLNFSMERLNLHGWALLKVFFIRRAFRLYPLSIVCVLLVLVLKVPVMPWEEYSWEGWGSVLSNFILATNLSFSKPILGPLWSLPIEAQMYIALPLMFIALAQRQSLWTVAGLWVFSVATASVQPNISDRLSVIGFAPYFIAGVLSYSLRGELSARCPAKYWLPFLISLVLAYFWIQRSVGGIYNKPLQWFFCLIVGVCIPCFFDSKNGLLNSVTHLIAKYSYGIYLFHCIALWIACFKLSGLPVSIQWPLALAILIGMSVAGFHWIEKPAIDYGVRLSFRFSHREYTAGEKIYSI